MDELNGRDLEILTGPNYGTFVTVNPDGSPHATITWVDQHRARQGEGQERSREPACRRRGAARR